MTPQLESLEPRDCPAMVSSGGVVYGLDDATGAVQWSRPLDPAFTGPLFVAGLDGGDFLVGAGQGGGPRVARVDGRTLAEEWSVFVGDPQSRTGVSVAAWNRVQSPLQAALHPNVPGDVSGVQRSLDAIPNGPARLLAATGFHVVVFGGTGGLPSIPEFAALAGVSIGIPGLDGRTWDSVNAATQRDTTWIRDDQSSRVVREVGIGLWHRLGDSDRAEWRAVHAAATWETDTLRLVAVEAFAEAFGWWVHAGRDVGGFFGAWWERT